MKRWQSTFLGIGVLVAAVSSAQAAQDVNVPKKPVAQWSCQDFLEVQESFKPQVIYWVEALNKKGKPREAWIDVGGTETMIPVVIENCKKQPNSNFLDSVKTTQKTTKAPM